MNIKSLEIFLSVAAELNMTAVAEKFFISQPAVSQAIMELERQLGTSLFERAYRKLTLTSNGEKFLLYAKRIIALHDEAVAELNGIFPIRIGASTSIGIYIMPGLIKTFNLSHENFDISLKIENTESILEMLADNTIDMAFVEGNVLDSKFITEKIWKDEILFISPANKFRNDKILSPSILKEENFIMRESGSGTRSIIEEKLMAKKVKLNIKYEFGNTEAIKRAVESGMGISAVSQITIRDELRSGRLSTFKVKGIRMERDFYLVLSKNKKTGESTDKLSHFCRNYSIR